jgi:hypothetical protein
MSNRRVRLVVCGGGVRVTAARPPFGSVSRIVRVGDRCIRLLEPLPRHPLDERPPTWRVEVLDRSGELLDVVEVDSWLRACEAFDAFAGAEVSA